MEQKITYHFYIVLACFLLSTQYLSAQEKELELTQNSLALDTLSEDKTKVKRSKKIGILDMFDGNPGKAALYSAILPGAGQIYNKQYWKAPVMWGLQGTATTFMISNHLTYKRWDNGYKAFLRSEITDYRGLTNDVTIKNYRDLFRKYRDYSIIAMIAAHVVNIADAFASRHLIEFDVEDDISIIPSSGSMGIGIAINLNK